MATKTDAKNQTIDANSGADSQAIAEPTANKPAPAALTLGQAVTVKVAPDVVLINNETGRHFEADVATPVTVTVTLLRRLADGDLVQV